MIDQSAFLYTSKTRVRARSRMARLTFALTAVFEVSFNMTSCYVGAARIDEGFACVDSVTIDKGYMMTSDWARRRPISTLTLRCPEPHDDREGERHQQEGHYCCISISGRGGHRAIDRPLHSTSPMELGALSLVTFDPVEGARQWIRNT